MLSNWISVKDKLPEECGRYLIASRICGDYPFHISVEWWDTNIGESYPFCYDIEYQDRKTGGWVVADREEDYEDRYVEYWMEIEPVQE